MALNKAQRGVAGGMATALVVVLAGGAAAIGTAPPRLLPGPGTDDRLGFLAAWELLVIFWLIVGIMRLAKYRFFSPEDIDGGGLTTGTARAKLLQSQLQNTLEQVVLAVAVHAAWALAMPASSMAAIPVAAWMFFVGRALFMLGYERGAAARSFGFALTFYSSVAMFAAMAIWIGSRALG